METIDVIALTLGVAWASGINLYAAILVLGLMGSGGYTQLPESLMVLQDPLVLGAAGIMYFVEFFADKVPGVDTGWDTIHTFIRIPAGAMLAAVMQTENTRFTLVEQSQAVGMMLVIANLQALTTDIPLAFQVVFVTPNFDDLIIFSANFQSA